MNSYNNNQYCPRPAGLWQNAPNQDLLLPRIGEEMRQEATRLKDEINKLEKELDELEQVKKRLVEKSSEVKECEKMFAMWGGVILRESTESKCYVLFPCILNGRYCEEFSIGFRKLGPFWNVDHYHLPPCMKLIPQRVEEAYMDTVDKLASMVRGLQFETDLFHRRNEQFKEAMTLPYNTVRIFPAKNSLVVALEFLVDDDGESDLSQVSVFLSYKPEKFLPEPPKFQFRNGDADAQEDFKKQLSVLEHIPLKDAILHAFHLDESLEQNVDNISIGEPLETLNESEPKHKVARMSSASERELSAGEGSTSQTSSNVQGNQISGEGARGRGRVIRGGGKARRSRGRVLMGRK